MNCVSTSVWKRDKDRQVLCATVWVCLCVFQHVWSARTYRVNIYCMNECFYTLTIVISLHSLLRPHRAFFGTMKDTFMPANILSHQCMNVKYVVLPHIATLLNAECTSGMCFFVCLFFLSQGVERPLQPQPRPVGVDSQQWQPPHPLQYGVHLLRAIRTLGGWWGAQWGGGQPPGGQVRENQAY